MAIYEKLQKKCRIVSRFIIRSGGRRVRDGEGGGGWVRDGEGGGGG